MPDSADEIPFSIFREVPAAEEGDKEDERGVVMAAVAVVAVAAAVAVAVVAVAVVAVAVVAVAVVADTAVVDTAVADTAVAVAVAVEGTSFAITTLVAGVVDVNEDADGGTTEYMLEFVAVLVVREGEGERAWRLSLISSEGG